MKGSRVGWSITGWMDHSTKMNRELMNGARMDEWMNDELEIDG